MYLSVIVPVYNEEECIQSSIDRIIATLGAGSIASQEIEVILINDGSSDRTLSILESYKSEGYDHIAVRVLNFSRNFGHSAAVLAGLEHAKGQYVSIIDADMQDPPELILPMLEKLKDGFDVVYGKRVSRQGESIFKKLSAWAFYRLINVLASIDIPKDAGDFRVMTREVVNALLSCNDQSPFIRGLVAWVGFKQLAFAYERDERKLGQTKYPFRKMIKFAWQAISSFSNSPLLFITYLGTGMFLISCLISLWAIIEYFRGQVIQGWTSLLLGFLLGNSVTLIMLGIMGLYLAKIIDQVKGRPRYILRK